MLNAVLQPLGVGVFHCGIEVFGLEWSYGSSPHSSSGTGVFCCVPKRCEAHGFHSSTPLGCTPLLGEEFEDLIAFMREEWIAKEYDTLRQNCCHFADVLSRRLLVGRPPSWVMALPASGAALALEGDRMCCKQAPPPVAPHARCCSSDVARAEDEAQLLGVPHAVRAVARDGAVSPESTGSDDAEGRAALDERLLLPRKGILRSWPDASIVQEGVVFKI